MDTIYGPARVTASDLVKKWKNLYAAGSKAEEPRCLFSLTFMVAPNRWPNPVVLAQRLFSGCNQNRKRYVRQICKTHRSASPHFHLKYGALGLFSSRPILYFKETYTFSLWSVLRTMFSFLPAGLSVLAPVNFTHSRLPWANRPATFTAIGLGLEAYDSAPLGWPYFVESLISVALDAAYRF